MPSYSVLTGGGSRAPFFCTRHVPVQYCYMLVPPFLYGHFPFFALRGPPPKKIIGTDFGLYGQAGDIWSGAV